MAKKTDKEKEITNNTDSAQNETENAGKERKTFAVVLAVLIVLAILAAVIFHTASAPDEENTDSSDTAGSISTIDTTEAAGYQTESAAPTSADSNAGTTDTTESSDSTAQTTETADATESAAQTTTAATTVPKTTKQAQGYSLPLSVNQALNALEDHYGSGYKINSTVEEDGYNYFVIYENGEKYASVKVNMSTGEATETLAATNKTTDFYLV